MTASTETVKENTVHFCTYLDSGYLSRVLALIHSLKIHCTNFKIYVYCMDEESYNFLKLQPISELCTISRDEFLKNDPNLSATKENRSTAEFYFTCTPSVILHTLERRKPGDLLFYCDADILFFGDPQHIVDDMGDATIYLTEHRFPEPIKHLELYGRFNVGIIGFRHCEEAMRCLTTWRTQCIEWCFDRVEADRFADQKYLDRWPNNYTNLKISNHLGINVAPWNKHNHKFQFTSGELFIDRSRLICYHFQGLRQFPLGIVVPQTFDYGCEVSSDLMRTVYIPYLNLLHDFEKKFNLYTLVKRYSQPPTPSEIWQNRHSRRYWIRVRTRTVPIQTFLWTLLICLYLRITYIFHPYSSNPIKKS